MKQLNFIKFAKLGQVRYAQTTLCMLKWRGGGFHENVMDKINWRERSFNLRK